MVGGGVVVVIAAIESKRERDGKKTDGPSNYKGSNDLLWRRW